MLRIKKEVDLKELENFGFHKEYEMLIPDKLTSYSKHSTRVWLHNKFIVKRDASFNEFDYDIIFDLIQAGLVEKIEE